MRSHATRGKDQIDCCWFFLELPEINLVGFFQIALDCTAVKPAGLCESSRKYAVQLAAFAINVGIACRLDGKLNTIIYASEASHSPDRSAEPLVVGTNDLTHTLEACLVSECKPFRHDAGTDQILCGGRPVRITTFDADHGFRESHGVIGEIITGIEGSDGIIAVAREVTHAEWIKYDGVFQIRVAVARRHLRQLALWIDNDD